MVLTIYLIKQGLWASLMFHAVIREGKEVAVTILYATCCGAMYKWGRILKRSKKTLKVSTTDEPQDELQNLAQNVRKTCKNVSVSAMYKCGARRPNDQTLDKHYKKNAGYKNILRSIFRLARDAQKQALYCLQYFCLQKYGISIHFDE